MSLISPNVIWKSFTCVPKPFLCAIGGLCHPTGPELLISRDSNLAGGPPCLWTQKFSPSSLSPTTGDAPEKPEPGKRGVPSVRELREIV